MTLLSLMDRRGWWLATAAVGAGLASGATSATLIALVNTALMHPRISRGWMAAAFVALLVGKVLTNAAARVVLNHFAQRALGRLCAEVSRRVLATPLRQLERVGIPRILTTLTDDVATLGWTLNSIPALAINLAVIGGCVLYLGWLSWPILLGVVLFVGLGAGVYRIMIHRAFRYLQQARDTRDALFRHFRTLTEGTKELKLHAPRRHAFLTARIEVTLEALRRDVVAGLRHHVVATGWSQALFYSLLGIVLFAAPAVQATSAETLTGYLLVILYMMNPLWAIIEAWPSLARGRIALGKVQELGLSLATVAEPTDAARASLPAAFERLDVDGVTFAYGSDGDNPGFVLGPLDFSLRPGEVVFLVGGNGSGKSTFVKVLTGLYAPTMGAIRLDGQAISDKTRDWYAQHFSAVFSDFYLFDDLLGVEGPDLDATAHRHLVRLELDAKVRIADGRFSTTALSQGQRKRLALLVAFMEDRPIYVFDEWAADQDVHYREIFYRELLPELRARGKAVVVISHDDRYYDLGDRIVKLDYGMVSGSPVAPPLAHRDARVDRDA
jgi:putative pyoverdin transport system ATP-binding/permease protein